MPSNPLYRGTVDSVSSTASSTSSSTSSTSSNNGDFAHDPRMPVLPPQSIVRPTIEQQERQRRLQQELQLQQEQQVQQLQQVQQQQLRQLRQPLSRSTSKDIPIEEYDRESEEGRERLLAEYNRERAEKRDRLLHRKLDLSLKSVFNAYPQILQTMAEIDPTLTEVSITVTLTTVSRAGPSNSKSTNKLSVTATSKSKVPAQDSQAEASAASVSDHGDSKVTRSKEKTPLDPGPPQRINSPQPTHAVATGNAAAHMAVSSPSLEQTVKISDSDMSSSPVASPSSSCGPYQEGDTEKIRVRSASGAKRVSKQKIPHVDEYVLGERLGKGTFAKVHKCKSNIDQKEYAMRIIPIKRHDEPLVKGEAIAKEAAIMKKLRHENIIEIKEFLHDVKESKWYMVLELCEGELLKVGEDCKTEAFTQDECRNYFHQLTLGMEYLHEHGIIHKDIKPPNILISRERILKIADFGISEEFVPGESMTISARGAGTPEYMAPELFTRGGVNGRPTDIWSMGVTLFLMWNGYLPFHAQKGKKIPNFEYRAELKADTPEDLKALLNKLLEWNPAKRITMDELREDPWVIDNGRMPLAKSKKDNVGVEIKVTEEDKKMAFKVLLAVAKAAHKFKESLTRKRGAKIASALQGIPDDVTHLLVGIDGAVKLADVGIDIDAVCYTNEADDSDTSEDADEDQFHTCRGSYIGTVAR